MSKEMNFEANEYRTVSQLHSAAYSRRAKHALLDVSHLFERPTVYQGPTVSTLPTATYSNALTDVPLLFERNPNRVADAHGSL